MHPTWWNWLQLMGLIISGISLGLNLCLFRPNDLCNPVPQLKTSFLQREKMVLCWPCATLVISDGKSPTCFYILEPRWEVTTSPPPPLPPSSSQVSYGTALKSLITNMLQFTITKIMTIAQIWMENPKPSQTKVYVFLENFYLDNLYSNQSNVNDVISST